MGGALQSPSARKPQALVVPTPTLPESRARPGGARQPLRPESVPRRPVVVAWNFERVVGIEQGLEQALPVDQSILTAGVYVDAASQLLRAAAEPDPQFRRQVVTRLRVRGVGLGATCSSHLTQQL